MADTKISALPIAGALAGTEPLPIVQGGATKRTTVQAVADLYQSPNGSYTPTFTPDGTVCTSGEAVTNSATFSQVGNIVTVMIRVKGIDLDFSAGSIGLLVVDTFPIPPDAPGNSYGVACIRIDNGSLLTNASEFKVSYQEDVISFWCLDTAYVVSEIQVNVIMQYRVS